MIVDNHEGRVFEEEQPSASSNHFRQFSLTTEQIRTMYKVNEKALTPVWRHCFRLEFHNRNFILYCVNKQEMEHWVKVFKIIIRMNIQGKRLTD